MSSPTIEDRAQEVVEEFSLFNDWMGRYEYLISMGADIPELDDAAKSDDNYIQGCQSDVWIQAHYDEGDKAVYFRGDSNADITKGLAALIIRVIDGQAPSAISDTQFRFLDTIALREHLSPQRNNGLEAMIEHVRVQIDRSVRAERTG